MSLPALFNKSNLPTFFTRPSPGRTAAAVIGVPVAAIVTWVVLPWWAIGGAVAFAGWKFWPRGR